MLIARCARAERFRGENEPLDPVAGHIPGARNRPYTQNLNADGTFKHPAFLRAEFGAILDGVPHDHVVHQCGSGVTACHNILAMEAGGPDGHAALSGIVERVVRRSSRPVEAGSDGRVPVSLVPLRASAHSASVVCTGPSGRSSEPIRHNLRTAQ